eukprot:1492208-Pleurochrysis_carterae.AAC.1
MAPVQAWMDPYLRENYFHRRTPNGVDPFGFKGPLRIIWDAPSAFGFTFSPTCNSATYTYIYSCCEQQQMKRLYGDVNQTANH